MCCWDTTLCAEYEQKDVLDQILVFNRMPQQQRAQPQLICTSKRYRGCCATLGDSENIGVGIFIATSCTSVMNSCCLRGTVRANCFRGWWDFFSETINIVLFEHVLGMVFNQKTFKVLCFLALQKNWKIRISCPQRSVETPSWLTENWLLLASLLARQSGKPLAQTLFG